MSDGKRLFAVASVIGDVLGATATLCYLRGHQACPSESGILAEYDAFLQKNRAELQPDATPLQEAFVRQCLTDCLRVCLKHLEEHT